MKKVNSVKHLKPSSIYFRSLAIKFVVRTIGGHETGAGCRRGAREATIGAIGSPRRRVGGILLNHRTSLSHTIQKRSIKSKGTLNIETRIIITQNVHQTPYL